MQYLDGICNISSIDKKKILEGALSRRILDMSMAPGSAIDELALCKEFGLSRSPVREALRQAAGEGYIEMEPNRAPRVSPLTPECFRRFAQSARLLYVAAAHLAATTATVQNISSLRAFQQNIATASLAGNYQACALLESALLFEIGRVAGNGYLTPSLKRILIDHARIQIVIYSWQSNAAATSDTHWFVARHTELISAIEGHDTKSASLFSGEISQKISERVETYSAAAHTPREDAT